MSKTIEFVEKEIESTQNWLEYLDFIKNDEDIENDVDFENFTNFYNENKEKLKTLQQIKSDLEAWETVKEDIEYTEVQSCEERPEYTYEFKKWSFEINEEQTDFEEKSKKLKKALGGRVMVVVTIKYVNYNGTFKPDKYWFKSNDDLKCNDYVHCDTKYGCVKGIVSDVYKTIDELIKAKVVVDFGDLKECCKIEVKNDSTK